MNTLQVQKNQLLDFDATVELINQGRKLILSGDASQLSKLPKGNWIGGSIPYFYLENEKGRKDLEHIYVSDFSDLLEDFKIVTYNQDNIQDVSKNGFENGFNFMILPALRDIHLSFALNVPHYENLYQNPLIGLIAGVDLELLEQGILSLTYNGQQLEKYTDQAVVLHAKISDALVARLEIINVFEPSNDISLEVEADGFIVKECIIDGVKTNLYDYIKTRELDISHPLVCDYAGASINVSFQRLDDEKKEVIFYAPLFKGKKYTTAKPLESYVGAFKEKARSVLTRESNVVYNCNCILNYVYGELDQHSIGFSGATTFGEIAYQVLNQTFTYLALDER